MGRGSSVADMRQRSRKQNADSIYTKAIVTVRKARREGCSNMVTTLAFQEAAQVLGISGDDYSMRTVKQLARHNMTSMGETEWIDF